VHHQLVLCTGHAVGTRRAHVSARHRIALNAAANALLQRDQLL